MHLNHCFVMITDISKKINKKSLEEEILNFIFRERGKNDAVF